MLKVLKEKDNINALTVDILSIFSKELGLSDEDQERVLEETDPGMKESWLKRVMIAGDKRKQLMKLSEELSNFWVSNSQEEQDIKKYITDVMIGVLDEQVKEKIGYSGRVFNGTYENKDFF